MHLRYPAFDKSLTENLKRPSNFDTIQTALLNLNVRLRDDLRAQVLRTKDEIYLLVLQLDFSKEIVGKNISFKSVKPKVSGRKFRLKKKHTETSKRPQKIRL